MKRWLEKNNYWTPPTRIMRCCRPQSQTRHAYADSFARSADESNLEPSVRWRNCLLVNWYDVILSHDFTVPPTVVDQKLTKKLLYIRFVLCLQPLVTGRVAPTAESYVTFALVHLLFDIHQGEPSALQELVQCIIASCRIKLSQRIYYHFLMRNPSHHRFCWLQISEHYC